MKTIDITQSVMEKVVKFEKGKVKKWLIFFRALLAILLVVVGVLFWLTARSFIEQRTFDMFSLFFQDHEVINELWQDTLITIWEEIPQVIFIFTVSAIVLVLGLIIVTKKKRRVVQRKLKEFEKYSQKE